MKVQVVSVKDRWFVVRVDNLVKLGAKVVKSGKVVGVVEDVFGPTKKPYLKIKRLDEVKKGDEVIVCEEMS